MAISRMQEPRQLYNNGGIMPRLNDLSGDVYSAEQMLQEINQRLDSAESTLGGGGGASISSGLGNLRLDSLPRQMPIGQPQPGLASIANYTPFGGETFNQVPEQFRTGFDEYKKENPIGIGGQAISYSMLPDGNRVMFGDTASASGFSNFLNSIGQGVSPVGQATAIQSPIAGAMRQGAMDGGRMRQMKMMEDEDDPTGGIMDLESGRQMYFLGKLVKKAAKAVKKVAKSPIGKAALLAGGIGLLGGAGPFAGLKTSSLGKFLMGAKGPPGLSKTGILQKLFLKNPGKGFSLGNLLGKGLSNKGLAIGIGGLSGLAGLMAAKEQEEDFDISDIDRGEGLDISDIVRRARMNDPEFRFLPGADYTSAYAEGGEVGDEGIMNLGGNEMDLRGGGFVPLGAKEKADDVPARLSKNEFVMTADAVRAAGGGSVDKGADKMYKMMKQLEAQV